LDGVLQRYDAIGSAAEAGAAATGVAAEAAAQFGYANLDMLMDVELNVTLCFGRRKMELKEIAELSFGAVVELDKEVQAPVDLMLGERVIARGDVVIVDGNYGLRVTQVCAAMA
jgi:flagellar motor switch protein FliN/FliY